MHRLQGRVQARQRPVLLSADRALSIGDPIPLLGGAVLKTLMEAIAYLAKIVPKAEQDMPEILTAARRPSAEF